jgi:hypothetical protein
MTEDRTRDGDWNRTDWEGEGQDQGATTVERIPADRTPTDEATGDRWTKTQWVGDQGHGAPEPQDPDTMPEGETGLSGDRHNPGEEHWARGQASEDVT